MKVDGKAIATAVLERVYTRTLFLPHAPTFVAFAVCPTAATLSYLRIKERSAERAGIEMRVREFPESVTTDELIEAIQEVTEDALIVQLPLPGHVDQERVLAAIPCEKDADVLSPQTRLEGVIAHPIAASVREIFHTYGIDPKGKRAAVVGQGWLVGRPVADWLEKEGAEVSRLTVESTDTDEVLKGADIIVSGAGVPNLVAPAHVQQGAVVVDVGTSELGGSLAGDVSPEVEAVASLYTPVPGGVGPVAVAFLMDNVATLAQVCQTGGVSVD